MKKINLIYFTTLTILFFNAAYVMGEKYKPAIDEGTARKEAQALPQRDKSKLPPPPPRDKPTDDIADIAKVDKSVGDIVNLPAASCGASYSSNKVI